MCSADARLADRIRAAFSNSLEVHSLLPSAVRVVPIESEELPDPSRAWLVCCDAAPTTSKASELWRRAIDVRSESPSQLPVVVTIGRLLTDGSQDSIASRVDDFVAREVDDRELTLRVSLAVNRIERRLEREVEALEARQLAKAVETMQIGVTITDLDRRILYTNPAELEMHGYQRDELLGKNVRLLAPKETHSGQTDLGNIERWKRESINVRRDGSTFPVQITSDVVSDNSGKPIGLVSCCQDISERVQAEKALRVSEERYALAARGANDGLWDWNLIDGEIYYSDRWCAMMGLQRQDVGATPKVWMDLVLPEDRERLERAIEEHLEGTTELLECGYRVRHHDGRMRWVLSRGVAVRSEDGKATRLAGSLTDLSGIGFHDQLTNLSNRGFFMNRLRVALNRLNRRPEGLLGLLMIDIDRFKIINNSLGYSTGDRLLVQVAGRLQRTLRSSDSMSLFETTLSRSGGDEFLVLLEDIGGVEDTIRVAERIKYEVGLPVRLRRSEIHPTISIGIALCSSIGRDPEGLVREAEAAMRRAKSLGGGRAEIFDKTMHQKAVARLRLETDLRRAIEDRDLDLRFQPIVELDSRRIVAFEALVRWPQSATGETKSTADFIAVAEESDLVLAIDRWVLESASRFGAANSQALDGKRISVNVSPKHFSDPGLSEQVYQMLSSWSCQVEVEVTERVLLEDPDRAIAILEKIRALGVRVCIDDFGTGYSSLSYLHRLPVDTFKVDRSFVRQMSEDHQSEEIVRTIVALGRNLDVEVIAEGIERPDQISRLRRLGCVYGQGFEFDRPLSQADALSLLKKEVSAV